MYQNYHYPRGEWKKRSIVQTRLHNIEKGANTHLSQTSDTLYNIYL